MRVVTEPFHKPLDVFVHVRVVRDVVLELVVLLLRREFALAEEPRDFEEVRVFGELLNGITAVAEDSLVAVNECDGRPAGRGVQERRVIAHNPEVVGLDLDLLQVGGANRLVGDRGVVNLPRPRVFDFEMVARRRRGSGVSLSGHREFRTGG